MGRLDRYIARQVFGSMLLVLLVLGGLDILFTIIDELGDTGDGYETLDALRFVLYNVPSRLYELLPATALIGSLAGLGVLAASNELVGMQAAGYSRWRITRAVMQPAILVMVLGLGLGEYVAPQLEFRAEIAKSQAQGLAVGLSRYGHWERDGNLFVHFNSIETFGVLYGVTIFEFDDEERLLRQITAQTAVYQGAADAEQEPGKKHPWQLEHGTELGFDHSGAEVQNSHSDFDTRAIELDLTPSLLQVLVIVPASMRTSDLWRFANRFEQQQEDAGRYFLAFWKKALQPLNTAVLVLVAISFIFGPLRSASMGSRVFSAVVLGLVVTLVQRLLQELSLVYHLPPLSAVLIPILLCFVAGVMLLQRRA